MFFMSIDLGDESEIPIKLGCPIMLFYFIVAMSTKLTTNVHVGACMHACASTHKCFSASMHIGNQLMLVVNLSKVKSCVSVSALQLFTIQQ